MEGARRLSKFVAQFEFGANLTPEQAQEWIATVQSNLPDGAIATVKQVPMTLNIEDLTNEHAGERIRVHLSNIEGTVEGKLDAVYPAGRHKLARTMVIDGVAYTTSFGVAQLSEW
jgi:hypothetical protein